MSGPGFIQFFCGFLCTVALLREILCLDAAGTRITSSKQRNLVDAK
jgi:hypothetical protein